MNTLNKFISLMVPVAKQVQLQWKIPASVCIAQAALETGWGQSVVGNNYFGIKASVAGAPAVSSPTMEFMNGQWVSVVASFSQYTSLNQCAFEYGQFLTDNPRYKECFAFCNSPLKFTAALQEAGYATDPAYSAKLNGIITSHNLTQYDTP